MWCPGFHLGHQALELGSGHCHCMWHKQQFVCMGKLGSWCTQNMFVARSGAGRYTHVAVHIKGLLQQLLQGTQQGGNWATVPHTHTPFITPFTSQYRHAYRPQTSITEHPAMEAEENSKQQRRVANNTNMIIFMNNQQWQQHHHHHQCQGITGMHNN